MFETKDTFNSRLSVLGQKHKAMSRGYVTRMRSDGLIIVTPRKRSIEFPIKGFVLLVFGVLFFKSIALASSGTTAYEDRLAVLQEGTFLERGGAWLMQADPVSLKIAQHLKPFVRFEKLDRL